MGDPGGESVAAGHVHGEQIASGRPVGDAGGAPDQRVALGAAGEGDDHPFPGLPHPADRVLGAVGVQGLVDPVGDPQQRQLPQGGEVSGPEVVGEGRVDLLRRVDVAVRHPPPQSLGRHVDQLDLPGPAYDVVGHRLVLRDPGDLLDDVLEGGQVLHVDGGDDVDAGGEEHVDVLPALGVAPAAGDVAVRELVDYGDLRAACEHRGDVHLLEVPAPVRARGPGHHLQAVEHRLGQRAPVALGEPHHHIGAASGPAPCLVEHAVGLADTRGRPEVDLESPASYVVHRLPEKRPAAARAGFLTRLWRRP